MSFDDIQNFPVLRSAYGGLTKSERRIADYLAMNSETIRDLTVSDIAVATQSSEITVHRFCKKLGCTGLKELKFQLAPSISAGTDLFRDIEADDTTGMVAGKLFKNLTEGLTDTLKLLDYDAVDKACGLIEAGRRIYIYGFGNSATVCRDFAVRFVRLGFSVLDCADSHMQVTYAALADERDVFIAISHSGATQELIESIRAAKDSGAKIIVITSHANSPLSKMADITLYGMGREVKYTSEAGASRLIHMAIGDILYTKMAMNQHQVFQENIKKMRSEIKKKRI